jgi:hypothetical protein
MPEARWGKWHRGLLIGENREDVAITGRDRRQQSFSIRLARRNARPHTIAFRNCRRFTIRDVTIVDSANYAILSSEHDVEFRNVKIVGVGMRALAPRARTLVSERKHHRLPVFHRGRRHRGPLLEQHGNQGLPLEFVVQRNPAHWTGDAIDHRK